MARKKHHEEHENLERWLVSYADFITLLFATFVVLYALSQLDLAKFKELKISLQKAFSASPTVFSGDQGVLNKNSNKALDSGGQMDNQNLIPPILSAPYTKAESEDFESTKEEINAKGMDKLKGAKAEIGERGLVIKLVGNVMFESSTAVIKKDSYTALDQIGKSIKAKFANHQIRVEGHTDNLPMTSSIYPSNWELSSARASSIVRYLISNAGIPKDRLSALGYSDSRPLESNNTDKGRQVNRRVEIVILRNSELKNELLSENFKKDVKQEVDNFKEAQRQKELAKLKSKGSEQTSDAVQNLIKEGGNKDSVIIFDSNEDDYKKETEKILKQIHEKERQEEEAAKIRKEQFYKGVKEQFNPRDKKEE